MENNFAKNLKKFRLDAGYTQEDLAKKLGKDYSTIGKWELGQRSPMMIDVIKIAQLFNISLEKLIGYDDNKSNDILLNKFNALNNEQKNAIINIIDNMK